MSCPSTAAAYDPLADRWADGRFDPQNGADRPVARSYRFITAWDSLWHVPLGRQRALMLKLMAALEVGGVFVFSAGGLDAAGEQSTTSWAPSSTTPRWAYPA